VKTIAIVRATALLRFIPEAGRSRKKKESREGKGDEECHAKLREPTNPKSKQGIHWTHTTL
jgi:hypothetical protein